MINGKGICQSYAEAFYLLAERAGLESVMVTGVLNGLGGHAWNRVKIGGQWFMLDVTNNDSESAYNEYFNMPDEIASVFVTEDDRYALNTSIKRFSAGEYGYDYYSQNVASVTSAGVADYLTKNLKRGGRIEVTVTNILSASPDELSDALKKASGATGLGFRTRISLWVLRVACP